MNDEMLVNYHFAKIHFHFIIFENNKLILFPIFTFQPIKMLERFFKPGNNTEAGVDEAGRGCLAGPVAAAAVILRPKKKYDWYDELNDSKVLTESKRNELRWKIEQDSLAWAVAAVSDGWRAGG